MTRGAWTSHKARVAADFGAAAQSYDGVARLQKLVVSDLVQRLASEAASQRDILDLGCGTGLAIGPLRDHYPEARLLAMDLAEGMIRFARSRYRHESETGALRWLVGDAESLPLADASLDLVFSSLAIQWCENTSQLFGELARVLKPDGRLMISTLVEGTLEELRSAWAEVDPGQTHVNRFLPLEALKEEVVRAFPDARVHALPVCLMYPSVVALLRELKGLGARYKDDPRRQGVTAPGRLRRLGDAYGKFATIEDQLPATYQVAIIHR